MTLIYRGMVIIIMLIGGFALSACSGGRSGEPKTQEPAPEPEPSTQINLSGIVTYDSVPHRASNGALNYNATVSKPVRGATVKLLDSANSVVATDQTDSSGSFGFVVNPSTLLRVRVEARLEQSGAASWDIEVADNTNDNALYVLDGSLTTSGTTDSIRVLHAPSGWVDDEYRQPRAAAPFAILDAMYDSVNHIVEVDPTVQLPPLDIFWSTENRAIEGDYELGEIGTSFYAPWAGAIYILGQADNDIDEYDTSVTVHEFAHYLEGQLFRTDSIGGSHSLYDSNDMRVAFSEGWGNAYASMMLGTEFYEDAYGANQDVGFKFSVEENIYDFADKGWYNEGAVQMVLYDIFDSQQDTGDTLALGFAPIYNALAHPDYIEGTPFTSIFSFAAQFVAANPSRTDQFVSLLNHHSINSIDAYGTGETEDGGIARSLPVYTQLIEGQPTVLCTSNNLGEYNRLDNRRFMRYTYVGFGFMDIEVDMGTRTSGEDVNINIFSEGATERRITFSGSGVQSRTAIIESGAELVLEYTEEHNIDDQENTGGESCITITISN
ncbi:glucosamine-fructose-6-phosphate aminotransferase, isomerizing [Saccharophagus degradans]|uniref:Lipoprotein n=1 Tax=Saccharophagus degradans (strain 2-40 / ATCC 43961 / DSM 17024) TaxID=203122 RepID=Q21DQ9_SACD2|nr:glucosamine-fructose-6-phosphate aminotransferase, isomerizing [Saccharophagus degradans]ABD83170.1 hypothetical protein Sde_3915 [Saccharophagus degradans 2-40]